MVPTSLPDSLFGNELAEYSQLGVGSTRAKDRNDEDRVSVYGRASLVYDWVRETTLTPRILPHVFTGDLGGQDTWTEIIFTNTTSEPCPVTLIFSQGTEDAPPVQFNQAVYNRNRMVLTIPSGSTRMVEITSLGKSFVHGSLYINQDCHTTSLNIQGRYLVQDPQGTIQEVYSISPEDRLSWLGMDHCKILMSRFGNGRDVGLAFVTARPGQMAPSGSQLTFRAYTWDGNEAETLAPIPVTGKKDARNPWELNQPRMVEICLDTVERDSDFQLAIITVGAKATRGRVQYFTEDLIEP